MFLKQAFNVTRSMSILTARRWISQTPQLRQSTSNHPPNALEKRFLVWTGKYKSVGEVPAYVNQDVMERCRNKMRIRIANIMVALTVVGACYAVYSGKKAAERGDTLVKQNIDWHKQYNEKYANKEEKK